jgi:cytochrome c-type protein NapB
MRAPTVLKGALAACLVLAFGAAFSQDGAPVKTVPRLTGTPQPMALERVPALGRPVVDDVRRMRNYPEQPPVIPHAIDGYQLTLNTNRYFCTACHVQQTDVPPLVPNRFQDAKDIGRKP